MKTFQCVSFSFLVVHMYPIPITYKQLIIAIAFFLAITDNRHLSVVDPTIRQTSLLTFF